MSKNCPGCGTPLEDDDQFCYKCGASFGNAPAAPEAPPTPQKAAPFAPINASAPPQASTAPQMTTPPPAAPVLPPVAAPGNAEPPKKGSGGKKTGVIIAIILAVMIAGGVGLFFLLRGKGGDSSSSSKKKSASSSSSKKTTESTTDDDEDETEDETEEETTTVTTKKTTKPVTTTAEPTTEAPTQPPKADISTYDRPKPAEFKWFTTDLVDSSLPSDIEYLTRAEDFSGGWKGMIIVDPDRIVYNVNYTYYVNFDISGSKDNVKLVIDWYQGWPEASEIAPMEDVDDVVLTGKEWNDGIYVESDDFAIQIQEFYEKDGKQYAVGMLYNDSGVAIYVAMVRP